MPKQPNITLYSCDRPSCVNKEYVLPNATASPNSVSYTHLTLPTT